MNNVDYETLEHKALAKQFWKQGYLMLEGFFEHSLMDMLEAHIVAHYGMQPSYEHNDEFLSLAATEVVPWFPQQEGCNTFNMVENDQRLQSLTEAILGEGWQSLYCMTMFSQAGSKGQAWHQDCAPESKSVFNLNRLVYTSGITDDIGGQVVVVPGSHKRGELTVGPVDEAFDDQLVFKPKKGTLILLHGHTWHRVLPVKRGYRVSTNFRSIPEGTPEDITDICVYRNMRYKFETSEVVEHRV